MRTSKDIINSSSSTSTMRSRVLFSVLGLTALASLFIFLNSADFQEILIRNTTWYREQRSQTAKSDSSIVVKTDNENSSIINVQGAQIFINCTCPAYVESNKTSDCSRESELGAAAIKKETGRDHPEPPFSILMGILTRADLYERRHFLRMIYGIQSTKHAKVDVRFVFCSLKKDDQKIMVALEILRYNDIIILNCEENMDKGKTYAYFSSLPAMEIRYDYVMKVDDDVYFRVDNLAEWLRPLPREDVYFGYVASCENLDPYKNYMSGLGYGLSWDLVEWIQSSPVARNKSQGTEDLMVGRWLDEGKKAKNRYTAKPAIYDFPGKYGSCSHDFIPDTIAVHKLKDRERWFQVLKYFNVTSAVNASKLYHL